MSSWDVLKDSAPKPPAAEKALDKSQVRSKAFKPQDNNLLHMRL